MHGQQNIKFSIYEVYSRYLKLLNL